MVSQKRIPALLVAVAIGLAIWGQARAATAKSLSEGDIVTLTKLSIGDDAVLAKIQKDGIDFPADQEAIERLKNAGVSGPVLEAIRKAGAAKPADAPAAAPAAAVSYQDVLKLLQLKIDEPAILQRLQASPTVFALSAAQVDELKSNGASDALIVAMQGGQKPAAAGQEISNLAVILDCSGSMQEATKEGQSKMEVAKKVVSELFQNVPRGLYVTFIIYGHDKQLGCQAVKVVRPLSLLDDAAKEELAKTVAALQPVGNTPIALALETAGKELAKDPSPCGIVLITDGMETCHGKPDEVAATLAQSLKLSFGVNVVGFNLNAHEQVAVEKIATAGKGKFYSAASAAEFTAALENVQKKITSVAAVPGQREGRKVAMAGKDAKPGAFLNDAPLVAPGEYKGQLAMMEAHYYQVPLRKGQELRAIAQVQKTPYEVMMSTINRQTFSVTIYDKSLVQVGREKIDVDGNPSSLVSLRATWTAPDDTVAYVTVAASDNHNANGTPGSLYRELHPKPSSYTLTIRVAGESASEGSSSPSEPRSEVKAGNGFAQAGELSVPGMAAADLKLGEVVFYRLKATKGQTLQATAAVQKPYYNAMNGAIKARYTLTVYDDDQVQVAQKNVDVPLNPADAQVLVVDWTVPMDGNAYVTVASQNSGQSVYPDGFDPGPGHLAVQVMKQAAAATTASKDGAFGGAKAGTR
jgi:hypothetical protein